MLDDTMKQQLRAYLEKIQQPIELVASLGDDAKSVELEELLNDIAALSKSGALVGERRRRR